MQGVAKKASTWGGRLKAARKARGLSQSEAARELDIPVATIRNWEQGRTTPPAYFQRLVLKVLQQD